MANTDSMLKDLTLEEMVKLRSEIDEQVTKRAASELAELTSRMEQLKGIVGTDQAAAPRAASAKVAKPAARKKTKGKRGPKKGVKVAPKYVDKATGNSWSGRGITPRWLSEYEAKGGSREDLAV